MKRRLSGVTSTVVALVPMMADKGIFATGPGLPQQVPHIPMIRATFMPRDRWRVWHARRNTEMLYGLFLRHILRRRYKLLFTSAAQRAHSGYTKWLIRQMDGLIATSAKAASYLEREATVILHGVDIDRFAPPLSKKAAKQDLGLPEDDIFLGCFGRVRENKGVDLFVDLLIDLCKEDRRVRGVILGRATQEHQEFQQKLETKIRNAGLHHRIRFMGEVSSEDLVRWYRALDIFIAPQRWEGFGLTPLEAMASKVPVIATKVGAFEEIVQEGVTGYLVEIEDVEAMKRHARAMLADEDALAEMGRASRAHVEDKFPLSREARQIMEVYDGLLADA
ncbi:MAG: glycosyltransferase family 4 protein [Pseudomonadota bacterium]